MENLDNEPKPVQPPEKTPPTEAAKTIPEVVKPKVKTETRGQRFLRLSIRWLTSFLIVFGLGALAVIFLLFIPQRAALLSAKAELAASLATADAKSVDLQSEVTRLKSTASENQNIQTSLEQRDLQILILKTLAKVQEARAALALGDEASTQSLLAATEKLLQEMQPQLSADQQSALTFMQDRLKLIKAEIGTNSSAAQSDLGMLAASLGDLEKANFSQP